MFYDCFVLFFLNIPSILYLNVCAPIPGDSQYERGLQTREEEERQTEDTQRALDGLQNRRSSVRCGTLTLPEKAEREFIFVLSCGDGAGHRARRLRRHKD